MSGINPDEFILKYQMDYMNIPYVLRDIDKIDWNTITDTNGTARHIPSLMNALLSEDEDDCAIATGGLFDCICTNTPTTETAFKITPFIIDIIESKETPHPEFALFFLIKILTEGGGVDHLRSFYESIEHMNSEDRWIYAIRNIANNHIHTLYPYLKHHEPTIRGNTALALGFFIDHVISSISILNDVLITEDDSMNQQEIIDIIDILQNYIDNNMNERH